MSSSTSDLPSIHLPAPPAGAPTPEPRVEPLDLLKSLPEAPPYFNRELSWLEFNARVLSVAENPATPLLDRLKFLAIYSQNLDEFFEVRIAGLKEQIAAGVLVQSQDGLTTTEAIERIRERVLALEQRLTGLFWNQLLPA
jgi:polyphosphate kinase